MPKWSVTVPVYLKITISGLEADDETEARKTAIPFAICNLPDAKYIESEIEIDSFDHWECERSDKD